MLSSRPPDRWRTAWPLPPSEPRRPCAPRASRSRGTRPRRRGSIGTPTVATVGPRQLGTAASSPWARRSFFLMLVPFIVRARTHSGGWVAPASNSKRPHDGPPRASAERSTRSRRRTKGTEGPSRAPAGDAETADLPGAEWAGRCANTGARPASCRSHSCADGRSSGWRLREVVGRVARSRNRGVPLPAATPRRASTARHHAWQWLHQASGWRGATALNGLDVARRGPCSRQAAIWSRKPMGHRAQ